MVIVIILCIKYNNGFIGNSCSNAWSDQNIVITLSFAHYINWISRIYARITDNSPPPLLAQFHYQIPHLRYLQDPKYMRRVQKNQPPYSRYLVNTEGGESDNETEPRAA